MEKDCYTAVRHSDIETQDILKLRKREEMAITLETSLFDANDDESKTNHKEDTKEQDKVRCFVRSLQRGLESDETLCWCRRRPRWII